jgi:hypothetical protein
MNVPIPSVGISSLVKRMTDLFFQRLKIESVERVDSSNAGISGMAPGQASVIQATVRNVSDTMIENVRGYLELKGQCTSLSDIHDHDRAILHPIERPLPFAENGELQMDLPNGAHGTLNVLAINERGTPHESAANGYPTNRAFEITIPQRGLEDLGDTMDGEFVRKMDYPEFEATPAFPGIGPSVDEFYNMDFDVSSIFVTGSRAASDEMPFEMSELLSSFQNK